MLRSHKYQGLFEQYAFYKVNKIITTKSLKNEFEEPIICGVYKIIKRLGKVEFYGRLSRHQLILEFTKDHGLKKVVSYLNITILDAVLGQSELE